VQQRRRSQAKKEEPAVLIQRSLAQHKASGKRVSTGRNAAAWAWVIGGALLAGLIIFLACWFTIGGGSNQCPDNFNIDKVTATDLDNFAGCKTVVDGCKNVDITSLTEAEDFFALKCKCIEGYLEISAKALEEVPGKAVFKHLTVVTGSVVVKGTGETSAVTEANFPKLTYVGGSFSLNGDATTTTNSDSLTTVKANCLIRIGKDTSALVGFLKIEDWPKLESATFDRLRRVTNDVFFTNNGYEADTESKIQLPRLQRVDGKTPGIKIVSTKYTATSDNNRVCYELGNELKSSQKLQLSNAAGKIEFVFGVVGTDTCPKDGQPPLEVKLPKASQLFVSEIGTEEKHAPATPAAKALVFGKLNFGSEFCGFSEASYAALFPNNADGPQTLGGTQAPFDENTAGTGAVCT